MTVRKPDHAARTRGFIFTDVHEQLRASIRAFVDREIVPHVAAWEETTFPDAIVRRMGELGFLGLAMPEQYGGGGGDYFCNLVLAEEIARGGSGGLLMGLSVHTDMVLPPILEFGTEEQKRRYLTAGIAGDHVFCLGITEPDAGSDVAAIRTRAVRDGDHWVINGAKTYITNGHRAKTILLGDEDRSRRRLRGFHALPRPDGHARSGPRAAVSKRWACTHRIRRSWRSRTCAWMRTPSSARSARASSTSCGSCRRSG